MSDHEIAVALNYEFDKYRWHFNYLIKQSIEYLRNNYPWNFPFVSERI